LIGGGEGGKKRLAGTGQTVVRKEGNGGDEDYRWELMMLKNGGKGKAGGELPRGGKGKKHRDGF